MEKIRITHLTIEEIDNWLNFMCTEIFPDDPREAVESMWTNDSEKDVHGIIIAKNEEGQIIGSVKAECLTMPLCGQPVLTGIISGVGICPAYRGRGLSKTLFEACYAYLKTRDMKMTHLYSKPDTLNFYLNSGYRFTKKQPEEDFYRMYYVLSSFRLGEKQITTADELVNEIDDFLLQS